MRVKWIHDCPMNGPCGYDNGGTVWRPSPEVCKSFGELDDWQIAKLLELTADLQPHPDKRFAMIAWDCRPGALQCHYWDELEVIE